MSSQVKPQSDAEATFAPRLSDRVAVLIVAAVAVAAYLPALGFQFVFDDNFQAVNDPYITSWSSFPEYFIRPVAHNFYRPLFMVWLLVNRMLFGLDPSFWHATSLLVHAAVSVLVWAIARRLLQSPTAALIAGLLFAVHPVHIEAAVWVSGITEPMFTVFTLGSFLAFLRSRDAAGRGLWLPLSLLCGALGMLSKETGVVLVALIFFYSWFFATESTFASRVRSALISTSPYIALTLIYLFIRAQVLKGLTHPINDLSVAQMVLTWPRVIWFYVRHLLWPADLGVYYDTPYVERFTQREFWLPLLALAAILVALGWLFRRTREPLIGFATAWFAISIAPTLYLRAFNAGDFVHDRYLYLPSVGFLLLVAWALVRLPGRFTLVNLPAVPLLATIAIFSAMLVSTLSQQLFWRTDFLLFYRAVQVSPTSDLALNNLGVHLIGKGEYREALYFLNRSLERNPKNWLSRYNIGFLLYATGNPAPADVELEKAKQLNPGYPDTYAYQALAKLRLGQLDAAEKLAAQAIEISPGSADYYYTAGLIAKAKGDNARAASLFKKALQLLPSHANARHELELLAAQPAKP